MGCGETIGIASIVMRAARYGGGCPAFATDPFALTSGVPACGDRHWLTDMAALVGAGGSIRVEGAAHGDVTEVACDDMATLNTLFNEVLREADGGGLLVVTWEDAGTYDCPDDCDDTSTLEQMLMGSFIRLGNGELRLRVVPVVASDPLDCDGERSWLSIARGAMVRIAPGQYAVRITVDP